MASENISSYDEKSCPAITAAKYLIQLFLSTQIQCNRQKLQKLVIFAHLALLLDDEKGILGNEFITASNIGLGVDSISKKYYNFDANAINKSIYDEEVFSIPAVIKKENKEFKPEFQYEENVLKNEDLIMLKFFFYNFAAINSTELSLITTKLDIYPSGENFLKCPGNMTEISNERVREFIANIKATDNSQSQKGKEIISDIIYGIITEMKKDNI